jgi:hypothetical protein
MQRTLQLPQKQGNPRNSEAGMGHLPMVWNDHKGIDTRLEDPIDEMLKLGEC